MTWKSTENYFGIYKKYWRKNQRKGAHTLSTRVGGAHALGRAPCLVGPLALILFPVFFLRPPVEFQVIPRIFDFCT